MKTTLLEFSRLLSAPWPRLLLAGLLLAGAPLRAQNTIPTSIFPSQTPANSNATDNRSYELGTKFTAVTAGTVQAIRYWKAPSEGGAHVGRIWSAAGVPLAQANFSNETASGWQEASLATPLALSANTTYLVSVNANSHFAMTASGLAGRASNGPLQTVADGANGVFGDAGTFPTSSYSSSNYFRDVVFAATPATLFTTQQPAMPAASDNRSYELGAKFTADVAGTVHGIRYWKSPGETGAHTGRVWSAAGNELVRVDFSNETASGWQEARLSEPLAVAANTPYIVSVNANSLFAMTQSGLASSVGSGAVRTVADGANGVFGDVGAFPTGSYSSSNYFRDVNFVPNAGTTSPPVVTGGPFVHRGYLGWITDLASSGRPNDNWPSIGIDPALVADYDAAYSEMQATGLNETTIWGFFASREWSVDVENTIDAARAAQVRDLIDRAHAKGIKVYVGLGVYSWGFEAIIRNEPSLSDGTNNSALCLANPRSWYWQKRVIDYVFSFPIDGVSLQSGDQGRCRDPQLSDLAYHAQLNDSVARYIKRTYPGKTVGINCYGIYLTDPALVASMTRHADYIIDVMRSTAQSPGERAYRRQLVAAIAPCAYGTLGGPFNEPPQHWDRERWFLPQLRRAATGLQELYADGGRAAENFMRPLANPGEEASIKLLAAVESNPTASWLAQLRQILQDVYAPADANALDDLVNVFVGAEDAYFDNAGVTDIISLEPLIGATVGPPVYLRDRMTPSALARYKTEICRLQQLANSLVGRVGNPARMQTVARCLGRVLDDVNGLLGDPSSCPVARPLGASAALPGTRSALHIACYPNPAHTALTVQANAPLQGATLTLIDAYGRRVRTRTLATPDNAATMELAGVANGLYYLRVQLPKAKAQVVQKVVVQH